MTFLKADFLLYILLLVPLVLRVAHLSVDADPSVEVAATKYEKELNIDLFLDNARLLRDEIEEKYPDYLLLSTALKHDGDVTSKRLEPIFSKCVTPGSSIHIAAVGGSITAGGGKNVGEAKVYIHTLVQFFEKLCPDAKISVFNASRGGTGSLTTGMCLEEFLGSNVDLMTIDFSLNDFEQYTVNGLFSTTPYELLLRSALTSFNSEVALYNIFFWGKSFTRESAQTDYTFLTQYYDVTAISMRDVVFNCIDHKLPPYLSADLVIADSHHPNEVVHRHLGDILSLHVAEHFIDWASRISDKMGSLLFSAQSNYFLPTAVDSTLLEFNLSEQSFKCRILGAPLTGPKFSFEYSNQWNVFQLGKTTDVRNDSHECMQATSISASGVVSVTVEQGILIIESCNRTGSRNENPTFKLRLISSSSTKSMNSQAQQETFLDLKPVAGQIGEAFQVVPKLKAGTYNVEIVPNGLCEFDGRGEKSDRSCTNGFNAIVWL